MNFERGAGILLHPTSLPGKYGIGDLGNEAYSFIDFLVEAGQTLWQVFPLGPTGYGDSPYQCFSAFAGNPLLVSPDKLKEDGFLSDDDLPAGQVGFNNPPLSDPKKVDFGKVIEYKKKILRNAFNNFKKNSNGLEKDFSIFCDENKEWLDDFSLFIACKDAHNGAVWSEWDMGLINREETAIKEWSNKLSDDVFYHKFVQFVFFKQWKELKEYTNKKGIKIIGDMPIFIAYDSSDLWANKKLFTVDENGKLTFVAGVPPDYFSETGQLWGNPLYKWDEMEKDEFLWWRKRFTSLLEFVDIIRIDHFRGFEAYWKIPGEAETAINGKWVKAPGDKLFEIVKKYLGDIPILAEDLGVITPPVEALRDQFGFPGMKVLQFAFGTGMETKFLPHNFIPNCVVYTGTHDNDTTKAYFEKEKMNKKNDIYGHAQKYLNYNGKDILSELIRTAYASVANIVVIPMQDIMNLGGEARMNFPSTLGDGNWAWRFTTDQLTKEIAKKYKELTALYERPPKPIEEGKKEDLES